MNAETRKMVVTGASSFLGMHLAADFARAGFDVVGTVSRLSVPGDEIRRKRLDYLKDAGVSIAALDITDASSLESFIAARRPAVWVHHAGWAKDYGSPSYDAEAGRRVNVLPLDTLYPALARAGCRGVIVTGSSAEYSSQDAACSEDDACAPDTPYGCSKLAETQRAGQLAAEHGLPTRVARVFIPFGILDAPQKLIPSVITALRQKQPVALSPCAQQRDFLYVDEVARGYGCLVADLERPAVFDLFNLSSGEATTLRDFLLRLAARIGASPDLLRFGERAMRIGEPPVSYGSIDKAAAVLGWRPASLAAGVEAYLVRGDAI